MMVDSTQTFRRVRADGLVGSIALLTLATPAIWAQEAAQLEEIVVTAQKRAESAQDVPIAISVLGREDLDESGFDGFDSLSTLVPSLQIGNFGPVTFINMRGIGNENTTAGGDPGVALHYDGVYLGRPVAYLFSSFDSERVEVLRGPQGTLYGRNATGGSINYITRKPEKELGGEADLTLGDYQWVRFRGALNLPLGNTASSRIVAFAEERDGFTRNPAPGGRRPNDADNRGARVHLQFDPSEATSILLSATYVDVGGVGRQAELRTPFPGTLSVPVATIAGPPGFAFSPGGPMSGVPASNRYVDAAGNVVLNDLRPFVEANDYPESLDSKFQLASVALDHDFGAVALRSITAYVETEYASDQDADQGPLDLAELLLTESAEQISQELQLLSTGEGAWEWIVGAYYFKEDADRRSQFFRSRYSVFAAIAGVPSGFDVGGDVETRSWATFGQASYRISDALKLTAGVRYSDDQKKGTNRGFQFTGRPYADPVAGSWSRVTYRLSADYQFSDDVLGYASFSTGYKSGGINQVAAISLGARNAVYNPEFVDAIELGLKSTLLDRRLQLNGSLYRNTYDDLQFQIFGLAGPEAFNARGATVTGLEIEAVALLSDAFTVDLAIGYMDSEFDAQVIDGVNLGGKQVQRTPEWTANVAATYARTLGSNGAIKLRAEYGYTDEIFYTALNRSAAFPQAGGSDLAASYDNVNVRLFWTSASERLTLELAATNLTDEVQEGNVFRGIGFLDVPGGGGLQEIAYNPPRLISGRIAFRF
jgi:iron complex outermembrane recepter protein